jgi:diguanylate cyclase
MDAAAAGAAAHGLSAAALAKGALRRLAHSQQEPTPENYAKAYALEAGLPPPADAVATGSGALAVAPAATAMVDEHKAQGASWASLVERLAKNLERGGKQWTAARRKDSLRRVFDSSRSDAERLLSRLQSLMTAWETDHPDDPSQASENTPAPVLVAAAAPPAPATVLTDSQAWAPVLHALEAGVRAALPADQPSAVDLADELQNLAQALANEGIGAERVAAVQAVCQHARRLFGQRHQLVESLASLCQDLGASMADLAEDGSWVQGQCQLMQSHLLGDDEGDRANAPSHSAGISVRGVRAASAVLAQTRLQQKQVRDQRVAARDALKQLIQSMLQEVGALGEQTGRFEVATSEHALAIARADTLEGLAGVVQAMLADARTVHSAVTATQERLQADQLRASELESKVLALEGELRRLSSEVSTDALTQVANRRGLMQAFEMERARAERAGGGASGAGADGADGATTLSGGAAGSKSGLAVALIDIDNFKKLNDSLGHAAGDQALKTLAAAVRERLRPVDHLARFGGEEFVVLLPGANLVEAQQALTRLQRSLSEALFLHDGREVFVTFSAGVTLWRTGETLDTSLERADAALYEAKRTGKNRTCIGE